MAVTFPIRLVLTVVWWVCVTRLAYGLVFDFDCRRNGVDCNQGKCDVSNGNCDCSGMDGITPNYKCQNQTEFPCSESTYGQECSRARVEVDCTLDNMFVNVMPDGNFQGSVFVLGKEGVAQCQLLADAPIPEYFTHDGTLQGFRLDLPNTDANCGDAVVDVQEDEGNGTRTVTITRDYFVQYSSNFRSSVDQKVKVQCVLTEGRTKVYSQVDDVQEGNGDFKDVNVDADADLDAITFSILKDDQPLQSEVTLGEEIKLLFTLTPNRGYVDFSLASCTANNTVGDAANGDFRSIVFVENDCPTLEAQALFQNGVIKTAPGAPTSSITVSIYAFMFSGSSAKVAFACDVTLCTDANQQDCRKGQCAGITSEADKQAAEVDVDDDTPNQSANNTIDDNDSVSPINDNSTVPDNGSDTDNGQSPPDDSTADNSTETVDNSTETADNSSSPINEESSQNNAATISGDENTSEENNAATGDNVIPPQNDQTDQGESDAARRRRRDASGDTKRVYSEVTVRDPDAVLEAPSAPATLPQDTDCLQDPDVIVIIAILAVLAFTMTLITCLVVCHVIRTAGPHKKDGGGHEKEMRTAADYNYNNGLPCNFNIPRLEIRAKHSHNTYTTTT